MSSFRNYSSTGAYRPRIDIDSGSTFKTAGSTYGNYRNSYTGIGSSSLRTSTIKGKSIANFYTTNYMKKDGDKVEQKPSYKYSLKSPEKEKLSPGKLFKDDSCSRNRSNGSSLGEKYTVSSGKLSSERSTCLLTRYRGSTSRETSREPETKLSRFGGQNSHSESRSIHADEKKDKDHDGGIQRKPRNVPTRTSRELSPEISPKGPSHRICSQSPTFRKNSNTSNTAESSSKTNGTMMNGRNSVESTSNHNRVATRITPKKSERYRSLNIKSESPSILDNIPSPEQINNEMYLGANELNSNLNEIDPLKKEQNKTNDIGNNHLKCGNDENIDDEVIIISVVTRGTSPTPPPPLTAFTRTRKLERIPKPIQKEVKKSQLRKIQTREQEQQVECANAEDSFRDRYISRYNNSNIRKNFGAPWVSSYLDKLTSPPAKGNSTSYISQSNNSSPTSKVIVSSQYSKSNANVSITKNNSKTSESEESLEFKVVRRNSSSSSSSISKETNPQVIDRSSSKIESNQKRRNSSLPGISSDDHKYHRSQEDSGRIVEGQDHGHDSGSISFQKESLSKSSDSSSSSQSKPGSTSRSSSSKLRHMTSSQSCASVNVPVGSGGGNSSSRSSSCKSASSVSSGTTATVGTMTKIKSGVTTTTALAMSTSTSKCATVSAGSSVTSRQASSPDAHDRKPPVPKSEMVGKNGTMAGGGGLKFVNKDFRKSALNMENGDPSRSQIVERKHQKKYQRSISVSSQDSQSEINSGSLSMQQVASSGSLTSLKSNKSGSKIKALPGKATVIRKTDQKNSPKETPRSISKSSISCYNGNISKTLSVSTSECSFDGSSSESCNSDDEDNLSKSKIDVRKRRGSNSSFQDHKSKRSTDSSRTSAMVSSGDELSINTDKPPRPPSAPRSRSDRSGKTEEAKSFLIRTLAPVTKNFKIKQQENSDETKTGSWVEACSEETLDSSRKSQNSITKSVTPNLSRSPSLTNTENNSMSDKKIPNTRVRRQSSEEKPWWLDSNSDNVPEGIDRNPSLGNDDISQDTTISSILPDDGKFKFKVWRQDSGERAWWLDANDENNVPEEDSASSRKGSSPRSSRKQKSSSSSVGRLRHQQSGERAWWMSDDPDNIPDGIEVIPVSPVTSPARTFGSRIPRVESGEKPWWLDSSSNVPEGVERISSETSNSDSSESFEKVDIGVTHGPQNNRRGLAKFPLEDEPLGDRASPEGIENPPDPPDKYEGRSSPYDNITSTRQTPPRRSAPRKRPANLPLFIGNHTNIDDLLGDMTDPRRTRKKAFPNDKEMPSDSSDEECEEIDATQVIIHDSTPQTPVIQRRHRDTDRPQPDGYIPVRKTQVLYCLP